jgi:hypothetical protein
MRHLVTGTNTVPVVASFEDDGAHPLEVQAQEALRVEAIGQYCLPWDDNLQVQDMQTSPVGE